MDLTRKSVVNEKLFLILIGLERVGGDEALVYG